MKLLTLNTKVVKSNKLSRGKRIELRAKIMQLAPHKISGYNVCTGATPICSQDCLFYAGMGVYKNVKKARIERTKLLFENPNKFLRLLHSELSNFVKLGIRLNFRPIVRLNGLSDVDWISVDPTIFDHNITFYDYTKVSSRYRQFLAGKLPANYHLTFSRSEKNESKCVGFLEQGGSVAIVGRKLPKKWNGYKVINGDANDFRFQDPKNCVVWLSPKGRMKKDTSGFVYV